MPDKKKKPVAKRGASLSGNPERKARNKNTPTKKRLQAANKNSTVTANKGGKSYSVRSKSSGRSVTVTPGKKGSAPKKYTAAQAISMKKKK
jgi:hypothetical protein